MEKSNGLKVGLQAIAEELQTTAEQVKAWIEEADLNFPAFRNSNKRNAAWRAYATDLHKWNREVWAAQWTAHPERRKQWK